MARNDLDISGGLKGLLGRKQVLISLLKRPGGDSEEKLLAEMEKVQLGIKKLCEINRLTYSEDLDEERFLRLKKESLLELNQKKNNMVLAVNSPAHKILAKPANRGRPPKPPVVIEDVPAPPLRTPVGEPEAQAGELPDIRRMRGDFKSFCKHAIRITYRPGMNPALGGAGPFYFNSAQDHLWSVVGTLLLTRRIPVRIKLLKARQLGCTTWLLAFWLWMCLTHKNYSVMFIIDKDEHNITKREMVVGWLKYIRATFGGEFPYLEKKEGGILFLSNGSKIFFESAQAPNPGTSETIMGLHESEKPKWPNNRAKQVQESVTPGLPFAPFTMHVDESTAVGMDEFYDGWVRATEQEPGGEDYVLPIFLPWYFSAEYTLPVKNFKFENDDEELKDTHADEGGNEILINEEEYCARYKLTHGQILWRRRMIKKTFDGVRGSFDQEYPTTPEHAWRNTATNFFTKVSMAQMKANIRAPIFRGDIVDAQGYNNIYHPCLWRSLRPVLVENKYGTLKIWEMPVLGRKYSAGADFAEGKTVVSQGEPEPDETAISIKDEYGVTVALYSSHCKPEEAWLPLLLIAMFFNDATVNGERNSIGHTVLSYFVTTGYPNNLVNQFPEGRPVVERMWTTVNSNRIELLNKLRSAYSVDPRRVYSQAIYDQIEHFVNKMIGTKVKPQAANGYHDDYVMAEVHANHCRLWMAGGVDHRTPPAFIPKIVEVQKQGGWTLLDTDMYDDD